MIDDYQIIEPLPFDFAMSRRGFVQVLGAGLIIAAAASNTTAQQRNRAPVNLDARLHIGKDGIITVMSGKVECGQGARAELTQAAAEELGVGVEQVRVVLADTQMCPDDGNTAGSRTTPATVPAVRQACATARNLLTEFAKQSPTATYAVLASAENAAQSLKQAIPRDVSLIQVKDWKVLGTSLPRPNGREIVTGQHIFPADIVRPGMLYGKVLRPPSFGAKLAASDPTEAKAIEGAVVVQDGSFLAVAAPTTHQAKRALTVLDRSAQWEKTAHPSSKELFTHLRSKARGGMPANPFAEELAAASKTLKASYDVAYVQHTPMEPRAAVAEWDAQGNLTVWTSTQNVFGVRRELATAFRISEQNVRVIVPDFGGGFGGKHTGETAVEAARIAKGAGKPVAVRWTRKEELTWAYFRPAAAIDAQATLGDKGSITSWHFVNVNSGQSAVETPYRVGKNRSQYVQSEPPLRHGSYRALASTANNFARESFMDELAEAAGKNPLEFRLAQLENPRLRAVLEEAARKFDFTSRYAKKVQNVGVGLACGTEKASYVAACVQVTVDLSQRRIKVDHVCQAYECGAIVNPDNLLSQVQGCIIMGLGPALSEEMVFDDGTIRNTSLWNYVVPRMKDVPTLDIHLLNRPDLPSVGAGETPIIAVAPAIANAIYHATGRRLREMPLRV